MNSHSLFLQRLFLQPLIVCGIVLIALHADAASIDELKVQIETKNAQLAQIEQEIARYEKQLTETGAQRKSLENAIAILDLTRTKLLADIRRTQGKIDAATLTLKKVSIEIDDTETAIATETMGLASALRERNETDGHSLADTLLEKETLSDFLDGVEQTSQFQRVLSEHLAKIKTLRAQLVERRSGVETTRRALKNLQTELSGQRRVIEQNKKEKGSLLTTTKNQEALYQSLLEEKQVRRAALDEEVRAIENQLKLSVDVTLLPRTGRGVLSWPLDAVRITQYFGNTPFASANPQIYKGAGHNGIDMAASIGTPVKAAASGIVEALGDTDLVCANASYGKWVLIRHDNGLSSVYGHLSVISVSKGQSVAAGDVVALSGNTGYSTGPHLHLTVLATQGMKIYSFPSTSCRGAIFTIPVADNRAYLNPLSYL